MAKCNLVFRKSVAKGLRSIPKKDVARILQRVEALQENPRPVGSEKFSGQECYRVRQGIYRIIYEVTDEHLTVTVMKEWQTKRPELFIKRVVNHTGPDRSSFPGHQTSRERWQYYPLRWCPVSLDHYTPASD